MSTTIETSNIETAMQHPFSLLKIEYEQLLASDVCDILATQGWPFSSNC